MTTRHAILHGGRGLAATCSRGAARACTEFPDLRFLCPQPCSKNSPLAASSQRQSTATSLSFALLSPAAALGTMAAPV